MTGMPLTTFLFALFLALLSLVLVLPFAAAAPVALTAALPLVVPEDSKLVKDPQHGRCGVHVHHYADGGMRGFIDISIYDNDQSLIGLVEHAEYDYSVDKVGAPIWAFCQLGSPMGVYVSPKDLNLHFKLADDEWGAERCSVGAWDFRNLLREMAQKSATSDWDCGFAC